jgi:hypothetical protein
MYKFQHIKQTGQGITVPQELGEPFAFHVARTFGDATDTDSTANLETLEALAGIAQQEIELAAEISSAWYLSEFGKMDVSSLDYELYRNCSTKDGVLLYEGAGLILRSWLEDDRDHPDPIAMWAAIESVHPLRNIPCVLYAYALACLDSAIESKLAAQFDEALNWAAIAGEVIRVATEAQAWDSATKRAEILAAEPRKRGAEARHRETHALRSEVIDYWRANIDRNLSSDKAATALMRIFPLAHRTLSSYISREKKAIPPASTL